MPRQRLTTDPIELPEQPPIVPEDLYTGGSEVHLRVRRKRDLRRLMKAPADVDRELIGTRPSMRGSTWSLQWNRPSAAVPGSIVRKAKAASEP
jgi:hypothetical protein